MQLVAIGFGCSCPYLGVLKDWTKIGLLNTIHIYILQVHKVLFTISVATFTNQ